MACEKFRTCRSRRKRRSSSWPRPANPTARPPESDLVTDLSDDDSIYGLEDHSKETDRSELSTFIRGLNVDEQIDLVALMWLGRGDGDLDNWRDLRAEASRAHNNRTASYLIGTPMLADYLEEALSQFGKSFEDFEGHL